MTMSSTRADAQGSAETNAQVDTSADAAARRGTQAPVSRAVLQEAIAWMLRLDHQTSHATDAAEDTKEADRAAWRQWLERHPDHRRAWDQLGAIDACFTDAVDTPARQALLRSAGDPLKRRRARRAGIGTALCIALLAGAAWLANQELPLRYAMADYTSRTGEFRNVTLADGTQIALDSRSAFDVDERADQRVLHLRAGRIQVRTGHGDNRALVVMTDDGKLLPQGTLFTVDLRAPADGTALSVQESAVLAQPRLRDAQRMVPAGRRVILHADRVDEAGAAERDDWAGGMLVVENASLGEVVDILGRYRLGHISLAAGLAGQRVSGSFSLRDTDLALATLARTLDLTVSRHTALWVSLIR
ncbi:MULTISPECIES: FecR domain-containing protein [unclassified Achromobacter]|uniref:FecR domain-containing protein n=1 Tax=unclassified Achromobacter TaxID=2626865 RepID=UPI000B518836|nr:MULTISPECIES: FecR domain-containing protein [unclassified Achromobacter]OWT68174.1 amino acid ABC transporter substrate-binding protein [Achromobacter sp. HZ34]OWT70011.1 amino acid ABC transporter substrate-binding protein [Achromobacter sp. HZ28]